MLVRSLCKIFPSPNPGVEKSKKAPQGAFLLIFNIISTAMKIGLFGDSYIDAHSPWVRSLQAALPGADFDSTGKGGANLFYAIYQYQERIKQHGDDCYDFVIFTLTWPERLFSVWPYRNNQFCARSEWRESPDLEGDPEIRTEEDRKEFLDTIPKYMRYIYDRDWRMFDYELEIRWIMELAKSNKRTQYIVIPNTEESRQLALKHYTEGVLLDFAFETLSNREEQSPGPMPICDQYRKFHLNDRNHELVCDMILNIIRNQQQQKKSMIVPVDITTFDVVK
jgi:hypothetical protein